MTGRDPLDPGAQTQHLLGDERSEAIFSRHIAPTLLAGGEPQRHPRVVLLSAQPAAGKTTISRLLRTQLDAAGGAVDLNVDRFVAFHPDLAALKAADELTAEDLVHADARRWLDHSIDHLVARRVHIVLEHGLRSREVTEALLARFARAGYAVEGALLATPRAQSLLGNLARYQAAHEATGAGRFVRTELHDVRYTQLLDVADRLQDDPRVSALSIYRRDGVRLHHTTRRDADGTWVDLTRLREVLRTERDRTWTAAQTIDFLQLHAHLSGRLGAAWASSLQEAHAAADTLLDPDVAQCVASGVERSGPPIRAVRRSDAGGAPPPQQQPSQPRPEPGRGRAR